MSAGECRSAHASPPCRLLLPGDWHTPTGGYVYDRRIAAGLRELGWPVQVLALDASFPFPTAEALARAEAAVAALPDGTPVITDGLAFGAMPETAERHARRLRWVALVHHPLHLETGLAQAQRQALFASEARALAAARRVVVTSVATAGHLAALGVPPGRITVVEPGCDPAPLAAGSGEAGLNLLCVATLTPRKGHALLLDALAGLGDRAWTLHCVGSLSRDAATAAQVREAIGTLGLHGRVHLHGELDDAALARRYDEADAFVLASHFEGYGMVFAEALAHGLPVIGTRTGAAAQLVPPGAGVLVPPGDAAALRDALAALMDDPRRRAALAQGARAAREALPSWQAACARFAAVLDAVAAEAVP